MSGEPLKPGDIIQLGPDHPWAGCLAFVDEVKPWGITANLVWPVQGGQFAITPTRADSRHFKRIGAPQYFVAFWQAGDPASLLRKPDA